MDADANEISGELGSALGVTLVGVFQLGIPWSDPIGLDVPPFCEEKSQPGDREQRQMSAAFEPRACCVFLEQF